MHNAKLMAFVSTSQAEKAKDFYINLLGLKLVTQEPMALVFDADGTMLRLSIVENFTPQPFTVLGWQVADMQAALRELAAKGVKFEQYDFPGQDADGVWRAADGTQVAWFKDPDGNLLSLTEFPLPNR